MYSRVDKRFSLVFGLNAFYFLSVNLLDRDAGYAISEPDPEDLDKVRVAKKMDKKANQILKEIALYLVFVFVVSASVNLGIRDHVYHQNNGLVKLFALNDDAQCYKVRGFVLTFSALDKTLGIYWSPDVSRNWDLRIHPIPSVRASVRPSVHPSVRVSFSQRATIVFF